MGDFRALPRRLRRRTKPERPIDHPTARFRISLCCIMDPVFILWPQVAVTTMYYLRHNLYRLDGRIRGGDDLRCRASSQEW